MVKVILEGGLGGHMPHLYENGDLTFAELKDVFKQASKGQLQGTEKTDGQNIKLSFNVKTQQAVGARNSTQIKEGGLTIEEMLNFFADHPNPNLKFAFSDAIKIFEKAVKLLDVKTQIEIFGTEADNWYNAEVMDDRTRNVVNYDTRNLLIHRTGHATYDKGTGKVQSESDIDKKSQKFMNFLEKVQNKVSQKRHSILVNPIQNLKALDNKEALRNAYMQLEKVMSKHSLSDKNNLNDLLKRELNVRLKTELPLDVKEAVINSVLGITPPIKKREVKKELPKELHVELDRVLESIGGIIKDAIKPIEIIVTDFAAEMLKTLESIFILDNKAETERLTKEVEVAIQNIQSSANKGNIDFLNRQLEKLKGADSISSAVEGFAFSYKGVIYKFTGKFAPVNQILGLSKYGRGSKKTGEELDEQQGTGSTFDIALLGGGFKPPHKGHIELIKQLAAKADRVVVLTSDKAGKDRNFTSGVLKGQVIDGKKCNDILKKMIAQIPELSNVETKITNKPLSDIFDYVGEKSKFGESILIGVGDKEEDASRFATLQKYIPPEKKLKVEVLPLKAVVFDGAPLSASRLREAISNGKVEMVASFLPEEIPNKFQLAQDIIADFTGQKESLKDEVFQEVFNIFTEEGKLEEMSSAAGGAMAFSPGPIGPARKKKMIDRKTFMEELELRKAIRKALILREEKKNKLKLEEQQLRKVIREILQEAKKEVNYGNTGLNKLGVLLKAKMEPLKDQYKSLATDKSQREAFKARFLSRAEDLFGKLDAEITAGEKTKENSGVEELEELNVSIDEPIDDKLLPDLFGSKDTKQKTPDEGEEKIEPTGEAEATAFFKGWIDEVTETYLGLNNPVDRNMYREYFMYNVAAILDQAEEEVANTAKPVDTTPPEGSQTAQPETAPAEEQPTV
jgi:cytidyltransferase-like protein